MSIYLLLGYKSKIILRFYCEKDTIKNTIKFWIVSNFNIIVKILCGLNIGIIVSCIGIFAISIRNDYYWRADFTAFYTGATLIRDSDDSRLYNLELQIKYQNEILDGRSFKDGVLPFNYPPYVAIFFLPFSLLPLKTAYFLWLLIQIILIIYLIILLQKISAILEPNEKIYLIVASLAMPYLLITLLLGSFSLLILIGIVQFYLSYKSGNYLTAGLWLSILALKPQFLVVPVIIVLSNKQWKTLIISISSGVVLFTLTGILLGWKIWLGFLERLTRSSTYFNEYGIYPSTMHNLKGLLTSIFGESYANIINLISFAAFILILFFVFSLWWHSLEPKSPRFDLIFALSITLGILSSPHLNPQDSLLLIAPLAVFLNFQKSLEIDRRFYIIFLLIFPLISWLSDFWIKDSLLIRPTILLTIILVVWIFQSYYKMRKLTNQITFNN